MGKKEKKSQGAAEKAAAQAAPKVETPKEKSTNVEVVSPAQQFVNISSTGIDKLSQNNKVRYMELLQERYVRNSEGGTPTIRNTMNMMIDILAIDVAVTEVMRRGNPTAFIVENDPSKYAALSAAAAEMGVRLPDLKALPAPTPQQLKEAGLSGEGGQAKILMIDKKNIVKEAQEKKKKEIAAEDAPLDPTQVKDEETLKKSLTKILSNSSSNPVARIQEAIDFYRSYSMIQAGEDDAKKKAVNSESRIDTFRNITKLLSDCTFALTGFSKVLFDRANATKSIVPAFCMFRNAYHSANATVGKNETDQTIADMLKILLVWPCEIKIAEHEKCAERNRKLIEKYEKDDAKKNELKVEKAALNNNENEIVAYKGIIDFINNPSISVIDNLDTNYNGDPSTAAYKAAHEIVSFVIATFCPAGTNKKVKDYTPESILAVAKHYAGYTTNLFIDPLSRSSVYENEKAPELIKIEKEEKK